MIASRQLRGSLIVVFFVALVLGCTTHREGFSRQPGFTCVNVRAVKGAFCITVWEPDQTPLETVGADSLSGNAWWLEVTDTATRRMLLSTGGWGEAGFGHVIDFSRLDKGILRLTALTYDSRNTDDPRHTPLVAETYVFDARDGYTIQEEVLLACEPADIEHVAALVDEGVKCILDEDFYTEDRLFEIAVHLRNVGVTNYYRGKCALAYLNSLVKPGALDELLSSFSDELEQIRSINEQEPSAD